MRRFIVKVVVKLKPTIPDIKGQTLKRAIESLFDVKNLTCKIGNSYSLEFDAENQVEALNLVKKISQELLVNEMTEFYEIRALEEVSQ
jgi:Phosphoribosylformylglycinamidine (FGAM) synthase, PurS component